MKIQILTDKSSWMNDYNVMLADSLIKRGHSVSVVHSKEELEKGDIAFFLSCFEIVGRDFLALNRHNIVVHESDLPKGKGWSPLTWQVLEGKRSIPICLFEANEDCDSGIVYIRDAIELDGYELVGELREKQGRKTVEMALQLADNIDNINGVEQSGEESFYKRRGSEDSMLDIDKSINEQFDLLRVVDNESYPAFFIKDGIKYVLKIEKVGK